LTSNNQKLKIKNKDSMNRNRKIKIFIALIVGGVVGGILGGICLRICCGEKKPETQSTVSVSGIGTVSVQPDMIQITVNFSHVAPTTKVAKKEVDAKMQQILKILQEENIEDKHVKTISLSYDMEMGYVNRRWVQIGQRAQQTIAVTINDIVNNPERFPALLDKITAIDKVVVSNIQFDIENKTEFFRQSRELAYQKAFDKARQYADLSNRQLGKAVTISEQQSRDVMLGNMRMTHSNIMKEAAMDEYSGGSSVPAGEREITTEINVTFLLE
jgi:uncharacterized protein YggE